jgi:hypothetical protein
MTIQPSTPDRRAQALKARNGQERRPCGIVPGLLLMVLVLSCAGCAKIGEPQPPEIRIPQKAADLAARQSSDTVVLTVSKPEQNTNGSEATTMKSLELLCVTEEPGASGPAAPLPQEQFLKAALTVLSIPASRFSEYLNDKTFVLRDRPFPGSPGFYSRTFRYAVLFTNTKNQSAGLSNQVVIAPVAIPNPPAGLSAKGSQESINLSWTEPSENMDGSKPPRIAGFNVYRFDDASKGPPVRLNQNPVQGSAFEDRTFQFDTTYRYAVSTVGNLDNPNAESLPSEAISFVSKDVFPPSPPKGFDAILQGDTVILIWEPSSSPDVAGYRLYRRKKGTAARQIVQSGLVQALSFRDSQVDPSKEYEYEIQAADAHGNESEAAKTEMERR